MRCGIPSNKSKPRSPTFNLHFRMANCTPPVMLNFLLRPDDPMTSPNCTSYNCFVFLIIGLRNLCNCRYVTTAGLSQLEFPLFWQILEAELRQRIIFDKEKGGVFVCDNFFLWGLLILSSASASSSSTLGGLHRCRSSVVDPPPCHHHHYQHHHHHHHLHHHH